MNPTDADCRSVRPTHGRYSLREYIAAVTIAMLVVGLATMALRLRRADAELARLHAELGYLAETEPGYIAAARAPSDQPLTFRMRIRVPESPQFRIAYGSLLRKGATNPDWYGAVPAPAGDSTVTVRIAEDPRDHRWKIAISVTGSGLGSGPHGTRRMSTVLPSDHATIFRGSHQVIATGITQETWAVPSPASIRLLDERWLVGEGGLLLYGDRAPEHDQIGIYAELQPDTGTL